MSDDVLGAYSRPQLSIVSLDFRVVRIPLSRCSSDRTAAGSAGAALTHPPGSFTCAGLLLSAASWGSIPFTSRTLGAEVRSRASASLSMSLACPPVFPIVTLASQPPGPVPEEEGPGFTRTRKSRSPLPSPYPGHCPTRGCYLHSSSSPPKSNTPIKNYILVDI